jgi:hypothetical protein
MIFRRRIGFYALKKVDADVWLTTTILKLQNCCAPKFVTNFTCLTVQRLPFDLESFWCL